MMNLHPRTTLPIALAITLLAPAGVWAQFRHPRYLHARSDLRRAQFLMRIPDQPNVMRDMAAAADLVERAIHELDAAAMFDTSDACECNNQFSDACTVTTNETLQAKIRGTNTLETPSTDVDYYIMNVPFCGQLVVNLTNIGGLNLEVIAYNSTDTINAIPQILVLLEITALRETWPGKCSE